MKVLAASLLACCFLVTSPLVAQTPYRILITNDDGVRAPGILALAKALQPLGELTIVAPAENQSGKGHSISISDPVYVDPVTLSGGIEALAATATPASCVKVALLALMKERPNLVVSGINRGYNLGMTTYVSGTVGGAREGALQGIPAVAASLDVRGGTDYDAAAKATAEIVAIVKAHGLSSGVFLNINVPAGQPKGIRMATQSKLMGVETWVEQSTPRGRRLFWNDFKDSDDDPDKSTDVAIVAQGFTSVTALKVGEYDATAAAALGKLIR
jgi:5'-nucleotidase